MFVKIESVANRGFGVGRLESGKVVFVEGAYPGEEVKVRITKEKKDYAFAEVVEIVKASRERRSPVCPYFRECGGCQWMDASYTEQLRMKREIVKNMFERMVGFSDVSEVVASPQEFNYRTKVEFTVGFDGEGPYLGYKKMRTHSITRVESCYIAPDKVNRIVKFFPELLTALEVDVYDFKRRRGVLKHVVFRYAFSTDQIMVIFVTKTESFYQAKALSKLLYKRFPWIHSIIHVMNSKDSIVLRGPYRTLYGEGVISEEFDWEIYQIPPTAFFQSNYHVAKILSQRVFEILDLTGKEKVLDLYCGVGFFSLRLATASKKVIGVESNRVAVKAAMANANINDRTNVKFYNRDVAEYLKNHKGKYDVVVVDPPRSGMDKSVVARLIEMKPKKIVYLSCEPSTLARDVKMLIDGGYEITLVEPYDMFPQTFHIETLVLLKLKN